MGKGHAACADRQNKQLRLNSGLLKQRQKNTDGRQGRDGRRAGTDTDQRGDAPAKDQRVNGRYVRAVRDIDVDPPSLITCMNTPAPAMINRTGATAFEGILERSHQDTHRFAAAQTE